MINKIKQLFGFIKWFYTAITVELPISDITHKIVSIIETQPVELSTKENHNWNGIDIVECSLFFKVDNFNLKTQASWDEFKHYVSIIVDNIDITYHFNISEQDLIKKASRKRYMNELDLIRVNNNKCMYSKSKEAFEKLNETFIN